jgi:hypothetical protein
MLWIFLGKNSCLIINGSQILHSGIEKRHESHYGASKNIRVGVFVFGDEERKN